MEIKQVHENKETGTFNPVVATLLAQAREKIYEAIAIESGDSVEEVKKFFAEVEKANKEAKKGQKSEKKPVRQHTLFSNITGNEDLVGICIIIGYQKKDADTEKAMPIQFMTSRLLEPLGAQILAKAAMDVEAKNKGQKAKDAIEVIGDGKEDIAKQVTAAVDAIDAIAKPELLGKDIPSEVEGNDEEDITEEQAMARDNKKENIPF